MLAGFDAVEGGTMPAISCELYVRYGLADRGGHGFGCALRRRNHRSVGC